MKDGRIPFSMSLTRRGALKGAAAIGVGLAAPAGFVRRGFAADKPTLVTSIRSLSNPYHAAWKQGAETYAKSVGLELVTLVTEGDSEKGLADIRAILAKTGGNMVLNLDPNDSADAHADRRGLRRREGPCHVAVEQAGRPAPLGPQPVLHRLRHLRRRALRRRDRRGAGQVDRRQGRHPGAGRHHLQHRGDRPQGRAGQGGGGPSRREAARLPGRRLAVDQGL